jgi:DNA-binding FrmR family transcriptional regulator
MEVESAEARERLRRRLSRIEGQVRGVRRMLDEGRDCREMVQQLAAIRSAVHHTGLELMRVYASQCLADAGTSDEDTLDYLIQSLGRWS